MKSGKIKKAFLEMLVIIILIFFAVIALAPFYFILLASFKDGGEVFRHGLIAKIEHDKMSFFNYFYIFTGRNQVYPHWYINSFFIMALYTVISLVLTSIVGFGLGAYHFRGKTPIFIIVLFVMMFPVEILLVPLYKMMISLKLINTYWGVVLPFVINPISIFFFKQYTESLPLQLMDAGRIDGLNEYGIFFRIMLPLLLPAYGAMTIMLAMSSWNNFLWPLIVLRTTENLTLPVGLMTTITPYGNDYNMVFAGGVVAVLPVIIIFFLNQRTFIAGLATGGIKE